jgi:hypothetical protein
MNVALAPRSVIKRTRRQERFTTQVHQQVMAGKPRLALVPRLGSSSN